MIPFMLACHIISNLNPRHRLMVTNTYRQILTMAKYLFQKIQYHSLINFGVRATSKPLKRRRARQWGF